MTRLRGFGRQTAVALAGMALAGCALWQRGSGEDEGVRPCPAAAPSPPSWTWKTGQLSGVTIDIPTTFHEFGTGVRTRSWRDGPRVIAMTLTSDAHATRRVPHLVRFCELEVDERSIEVVESRLEGPARQLLALLPGVSGGPILLVRVSTPYPSELDALRRVVNSIRVDSTS